MSYNLKDFRSDFQFLLKLKSYLKEYIVNKCSDADVELLRKGIISKLHDGRNIRMVLPHGYKVIQDVSLENGLYFVGFIGFLKPQCQVSQDVMDKVWNLDSELIAAFADHVDILAYISAERQKGGDWGNFVLLKSLEAIEKWKKCAVHHTAVNEISPGYYTNVRIHRGRIHNGYTKADQTLFLDYSSKPTTRTVKMWI